MYGRSTKIGNRIGQSAGKTGWRVMSVEKWEAQRRATLHHCKGLRRAGNAASAVATWKRFKAKRARYVV